MIEQKSFTLNTSGRGTTEITGEVERVLRAAAIRTGTCNVFVAHTSASLILCENADPSVRRDLETILGRVAPDGDPAYRHDTEGPDDMASHARSILTSNSLTIPVSEGRLALGTWQGLYLWEHRHRPHARRITVTIQGEGQS